jgi:hypothetical protein
VMKEGRSACQSDVIKASDVRRLRADPDLDLRHHSEATEILTTSHWPLPLFITSLWHNDYPSFITLFLY